jgi:hypothetical protein
MLQAVRFSPSTRLAPSASSTPSVTKAKNVQRQGLSPGCLDLLTKRFLAIKQMGTTAEALLPSMAWVAEEYASVLRDINSPKSIEAISAFEEPFRTLSRKEGIPEKVEASLKSYFEGIPTTQEEATPLAKQFSALATDINAHIDSLKPKP